MVYALRGAKLKIHVVGNKDLAAEDLADAAAQALNAGLEMDMEDFKKNKSKKQSLIIMLNV